MLALAAAAASDAMGLSIAIADAAGQTLRCHWAFQGEVGPVGPVRLRLALFNRGTRPMHVLEWGTPFEGWMSRWLEVRLDGQVLPYQGASVKRGEPAASEYLRLAPGRSRQVTVDVSEVYDLTRPGRYELRSDITLHDVTTDNPPRARERHAPLPLTCEPLSFSRSG